MPLTLYYWNFETGDTQGWVLGPYSSLDNTSKIQGVYSIKYTRSITGGGEFTVEIMSISGIDLSSAVRPMMIFVIKDESSTAYVNYPCDIIIEVYRGGSLILSRRARIIYYVNNFNKIVVADLSGANQSDLTIIIKQYNKLGASTAVTIVTYYDNIYIVDGGDREYNIALMSFNNQDRTIDYDVPEGDRSLPSGTTRFAISLGTSPHPLDEATDIFTYTAVTNQGSVSITSTDTSHRHTSTVLTPTTPPATFNKLSTRIYLRTAGTGWYGFDETIAVVFLDTSWNLVYVYVFRVAITINPYTPGFQAISVNVTYGTLWSDNREFTAKIHARSFSLRCYVRFIVGSYDKVQSGTVKIEVFSEDYSTKYGESEVNLTTGNEIRGAWITNIPVDTTLKLKISWSIIASARITIEVRPEFAVY